MQNIFISYRRDDASDVTGRIGDVLKSKFGDDLLFKDVDSIPLGTDFRRVIADAVSRCDVLLAVIGDNWLNATDDAGNRRIDDPSDFVHIEIRAALERDIPVIPVLVERTNMPRDRDLPEPLRPLAFRNAISVRADPDFHNDMERLCRALSSVLKRAPKPGRRRAAVVVVASIIAMLALGGAAFYFLTPVKQGKPAVEEPSVDRVRVALVIGNSAYKRSPLAGPVNDIDAVAGSLRAVGFRVRVLANASKSEILEAWKEVQTVATYGGVALLYYSGHGARSNGDDLIVPVDATFPDFSTQNCISVSELMREISAFEGKFEGSSGELILYSTAPGGLAIDQGHGITTSPFAAAFVTAVRETTGDIKNVFERVSSETRKITEGEQVPWISSSFGGRFSLHDRTSDRKIGILRLIVFDASRP
jgi:hypothetical protein